MGLLLDTLFRRRVQHLRVTTVETPAELPLTLLLGAPCTGEHAYTYICAHQSLWHSSAPVVP